MGGMGLKFIPVLVGCLLSPPGLSELKVALFGLIANLSSPNGNYNLPPAAYSPLTPTPPLPFPYIHS